MTTADAAPSPFRLSPYVLATLKRRFQRILFFSGAGMSLESGIATFRTGGNPLRHNFQPEELATLKGWRRDPAQIWGWYGFWPAEANALRKTGEV